MSTIYETLLATLKKTDTQHDLNWFAEIYGVNSELKTPVYEVRMIASKLKYRVSGCDDCDRVIVMVMVIMMLMVKMIVMVMVMVVIVII